MLFLGLSLREMLGNNIAVRRGNVRIIVLDSICDVEPKFLVEVYGIFVICLHMQIDLRNVLFGTEIKRMVQQPCTCTDSRIWISESNKYQDLTKNLYNL